MSDRRKREIRELAARTGLSYMEAARQLARRKQSAAHKQRTEFTETTSAYLGVYLRQTSIVAHFAESIARYQSVVIAQFAEAISAPMRQALEVHGQIFHQQESLVTKLAENMTANLGQALGTARIAEAISAPMRQALEAHSAQFGRVLAITAAVNGAPLSQADHDAELAGQR